ncbi:MAG: methylase [Alloprevotella sp.]|nr:methylase [Alloprevotella sp.]
MAWMRAVCGRLKSDYRYSKDVVYNNFPWPEVSSEQTARIETTAQAILDARALYPDSTLADLYDPRTMPPELRRAHQQNDRAVLAAYGFPSSISESDIVTALFRRYQALISPTTE